MWCKSHDNKMKKILLFLLCFATSLLMMDAGQKVKGAEILFYFGALISIVSFVGVITDFLENDKKNK